MRRDIEAQMAGRHGRDLVYKLRLGLLLAAIVLALAASVYYLHNGFS